MHIYARYLIISTFLNTSNFSQIRPHHNALHTLLFFLYYLWNPIRAVHMCMGVSHSLKLGQLRRGHALKRTDSPIFNSYQLPITPPGLGPPELFHHPHWDVTWRGCVQAAAATMSSWVQWSCRVRKTCLYSNPPKPLVLTVFLPAPLWSSLSLGGRRWYR